jgi:hypothetical protein
MAEADIRELLTVTERRIAKAIDAAVALSRAAIDHAAQSTLSPYKTADVSEAMGNVHFSLGQAASAMKEAHDAMAEFAITKADPGGK